MNNIISKKFYMELSVNDNKVYNNKELYCKLNDSIKLYVKLKEDGVIRDLTKCRLSMTSRKRGHCHTGAVVEQDIKELVIDGGYIVITPKREFTNSICTLISEITIYDEDEAITTQSFTFQVFKSLNDNIIEPEKDSIDTLIELKKNLLAFEMNVQELRDKIAIIKEEIEELDSAIDGGLNNCHIHENKEALDMITENCIEAWENAVYILGSDTEELKEGSTVIEAVNKLSEKLGDSSEELIEGATIIESINKAHEKTNNMIFFDLVEE